LPVTLYLVRHAHAQWVKDEQRPLSCRGRRDAQRVADLLQSYPIEAIYTSPFRRARETIAPLATRIALPVFTDPLLQERRLGASPGMGLLEAVEATWKDPSFAHPGGEPNAAAQQRGMTVVRRVQEQAVVEHVVLSSHGNLVALILQQFAPEIGFDFWRELTWPDVYRVRARAEGEAIVDRLWVESNDE
jgi:2,3-bisphosphoglycerate-dependent phosphoglycerate mutase